MLLRLGLEEGFAKRPKTHTFSSLEQKNVEQERQRALLNVCLEQTTLFKLESQESFLQPETGRTNHVEPNKVARSLWALTGKMCKHDRQRMIIKPQAPTACAV
jgi:hypothetical protein